MNPVKCKTCQELARLRLVAAHASVDYCDPIYMDAYDRTTLHEILKHREAYRAFYKYSDAFIDRQLEELRTKFRDTL